MTWGTARSGRKTATPASAMKPTATAMENSAPARTRCDRHPCPAAAPDRGKSARLYAPHQAYVKSAETVIVCGHEKAHQNILARAIDRGFLSFICRLCLRFLLARRVWYIQAPVYSGACFLPCPVSPDRRAATFMLCLLVLQNPRPALFLPLILGAAGGALCCNHVCACGKRFLYHGISAPVFGTLLLHPG